MNTIANGELKDEAVSPLSFEQEKFLKEQAYPGLSTTKNPELLKHIAEVWWNLCNWEKQRADILDTKAQGLLGLSSIAGTVVSIAATSFASNPVSKTFLGAAVLALLTTAILTLVALRIAKYGGFLEKDIFGAVLLFTEPDPAVQYDAEQYNVYLRDIAVQRWLVYDSYKKASAKKAEQVDNAQVAAIIAICFLIFASLSHILAV